MTRTLLTTVLLTALVASVAIGQTVPSTQTKITAQLVTDLIRSSDSALAERDGRATAMSALLRVAADMELLEILIAQRQLTADVALAGAHQNASPGAANVATGDYYNALGVAVGAYQNAITHAQASRSNRWSQIYTQGQQDLVNATQADLNGAVAAVQSAQTTLNNAVANQPPPTPQPPVTPVTGGPGVAVLGDQNYRKPATITSLSTGKRRPVSLVSIGVAQAPDGTAFAYGSHMAQPTTVGATTGGTTSWSSGYGYGQETWIVPAGAIRDEAGETYIIGYMTSPLRNAKGEMVKVALPKTKLSVGDALWLYNYAQGTTGSTAYTGGGGYAWTSTGTGVTHPGSAVGTPVTYPGSAVGTPVTYPGSAVGTPVTYPGTAIGSGPTLPSVAVLGDTGIRTGTGLSTLPTYPNLPTGYQVVGGYPTYPTTIPTIPITDPSSTAAIYKWPVIDGSGKVTTFATTEPTWGRTPALVAPAPGPTTLQPGQTLVQGPQGVHVLGDSSQRPTPLPTTSTTTPQPLPGGGTTPTPTIQPVIPQFGTTLTPTPTTAALPGADGDIANARTLYLQDIARYAAACDAGLQAATGLSANPGLMNSQMTDAIRTFRTTAMDRHAQYDGDVYRAIRSAR